jgi:hypothetical protein
MVISRNAFERKSLLLKAHLDKNNRKLTSKIIAKTTKEINFNSKLHNGNLEELSSIFKDRLGRLYEIEPITMLYVNPFSTLGLSFVVKDMCYLRSKCCKARTIGTTGQLNFKDNFWKSFY